MTESVADSRPPKAATTREFRQEVVDLVEQQQLDTSGRRGRPMVETIDGELVVRWVPLSS